MLALATALIVPASAEAANLTQYPLPPGFDETRLVAVAGDDSVWAFPRKSGAAENVLQRFEPKSLTWTRIGQLPFPFPIDLETTGDGQVVASSCTGAKGVDVLCGPFSGALTLVDPKALAMRQFAMPGGMANMEVGGRIVNGLVPTLGPGGLPRDEDLDQSLIRLNLGNGSQARYSANQPQITYRRHPVLTSLARDGTPWLVEWPNTFARLDAARGTFDRRVMGSGTGGPCMATEAVFGADGALYVATFPCPFAKDRKYELWRVDPATGQAKMLFNAGAEAPTYSFSSERSPVPRNITDLVAAPDGALWLSVTSEIWRYEPRTGRLQRFQVPSPTSDYIRSIALDRQGDLWFAGNGIDSLGRISLRGAGIVADLGSVVRKGVADRVDCRQACRSRRRSRRWARPAPGAPRRRLGAAAA